MEDVLDLYQPEYNPERPVVCFDETSRQLTGEVRPPIEAAPGRVARYDTEYQRNGTRNLFMICEPKGGWRHVEVTERRTAVDFAHQMRWLVDEAYPDAEVVRLVLDNLNTHKLGSLYEAFEPCEARRIAQRLEFHYTPTHGSWLNMAEIELSCLTGNAAAMPVRRSWCCKDWTAGCRYSMRDASLPPRKRPPVQDRCETASSLPPVMPASLQTPKASVNLGKRPLIH